MCPWCVLSSCFGPLGCGEIMQHFFCLHRCCSSSKGCSNMRRHIHARFTCTCKLHQKTHLKTHHPLALHPLALHGCAALLHTHAHIALHHLLIGLAVRVSCNSTGSWQHQGCRHALTRLNEDLCCCSTSRYCVGHPEVSAEEWPRNVHSVVVCSVATTCCATDCLRVQLVLAPSAQTVEEGCHDAARRSVMNRCYLGIC